ncbi:hypothetical protein LguiA_005428 [Lonicera macranthoides]
MGMNIQPSNMKNGHEYTAFQHSYFGNQNNNHHSSAKPTQEQLNNSTQVEYKSKSKIASPNFSNKRTKKQLRRE